MSKAAFFLFPLLIIASSSVHAGNMNIGDVSTNVVESMFSVVRLITAVAYVAGMGFALAGIIKFKSHRDAPTQVPLSAPIVLIVIGACLLFLPSILNVAGTTMFGNEQKPGSADGFVRIDSFSHS